MNLTVQQRYHNEVNIKCDTRCIIRDKQPESADFKTKTGDQTPLPHLAVRQDY